jgi:3-oxoacyl-(acyl-carrier-protein) synthase
MKKKRIAVTGMGILSPLGDNLESFYSNLIAGKSGISELKSIDTSMISTKIGGDLGTYDYKARIKKFRDKIPEESYHNLYKISKTAPFSTRLTMITAVDAFLNAGLFESGFDRKKVCAVLGGHNLHNNYIEKNLKTFYEEPEYIDAFMGVVMFDVDTVASIAQVLQIYGPIYTIGGTCTSAGLAARNAINEINYNDMDIAIVVGAVLDYSAIGYQAMTSINAMSLKQFNGNPEKASRPFDKNRLGFVPSHSSGVIILEDMEKAKDRGAHIYAEILAVDTNNDGNHLSNPSQEGQVSVITNTLKKAGISPSDIDYVNTHATSTPLGDITEVRSIKKVFGKRINDIKINATKSMLGHTGWTAHSVELIAGIMQMNKSHLHPSINIDELDPEIDIDVCANKDTDFEINHFLNNSFGFGGINCCTAVRKYA